MSFLSKIFPPSTRTNVAADLSVLKCDVHSHFIPGIDDGAQTMDDSIAMLREFSAMGYKKVVTTPHVMSDAYRNTPEIILGGLAKVRVALKTANIPIEIDAAAEYYLDFDFEKMIEQKTLLTFGKNYVLFELAFINPPDSLYSVIFKLITNGYKPILAHPERYSFWHHDFKKYEELNSYDSIYNKRIMITDRPQWKFNHESSDEHRYFLYAIICRKLEHLEDFEKLEMAK